MRKMLTRGSLERRFVVSILWVGVIPMMLAMVIGYLAAREAQQIATLQNLSTAAKKTADGISLAMGEREYMITRLGGSAPLVRFLQAHAADPAASAEEALSVLRAELAESGGRTLNAGVYSIQGSLTAAAGGHDQMLPADLSEPERITGARFVDIRYNMDAEQYVAVLAAPVRAAADSEVLGYLVEVQSLRELLGFILGDRSREMVRSGVYDRYEIVIYSERARLVVYPDITSEGEAAPPRYATVDPKLAERFTRHPSRDSDAFFLWNYASRGERAPVLLAYQRLVPGADVFVAVHRPTPQVFSRINLAALVTLAVTSVLIGIFCAVAYRIVNNTIIRPLSLLSEGAQIVRQGDLDLKLKVETGDEIEELANSFNEMAAALRHNLGRLRQSEEKYRSLVTSMRDGLFQTGADGALVFINPAGVEILGFRDYGEALGVCLEDLCEDPAEWGRLADGAPGKIESRPLRIWMRRPDGGRVCVELAGLRMVGEDGVFEGIGGTFRDVTRNVLLEGEAGERAERIAVINQIANVINSSLEAGLLYESLTAELRRVIHFDYAAISLRLEGDPDHFETRQLWPEPREGREQFPRLDGGDSCAAWVVAEGRALRAEDIQFPGSVFAFQFPETIHGVLCVPLFARGEVIGALNLGSSVSGGFTNHEAAVLEQLSPHLAAALRNAHLLESLKQSLEEVTRAREKLRLANDELKSLDEMKTNLLSNVSHELRTPLVAVMGYTDMVLNEKAGPVTETQRDFLRVSMRNVEKLVTLIENLLDFSRLHRGTEEVTFTRFDLLDCVRAGIETVKPRADARGITLRCEARDPSGAPAAGPVMVEGDKGKIGQVFNNLLSNAVKFNRDGGEVSVLAELRHGTVSISVSDTGIGIPPEALDKVFDRFYQVDSSSTRKYEGTGIGLAISQDIVRLHGSRITASSRLGEGASFQFTLPVVRPEEPDGGAGAALSAETHLLVEAVSQDRALSSQLRSLLVPDGIDVIHAPNPSAAKALARRYSPDCILVDTEAGPLGAFVLEEMLQEPAGAEAPIVLITNDDALAEKYRRRRLVAARIRRTFRKSTLLSAIHSAVSGATDAARLLGARVLCVDDDPEIGGVIARFLDDEGFAVDIATTGAEALERARTGDYWLVLLDIALSDMDGWEVCRRVKGDPELAGIKVFLVTGRPVDSEPVLLRDSGADGYLLKPFHGEDLMTAVRAFDAQRRKG